MASDSDSEAVNANGPRTPSLLPPRSTGAKDYKALEYPFLNANATDGKGHHLFEEGAS